MGFLLGRGRQSLGAELRHLSRMEESNSLPRFRSTASDAVELAVLADVSRFLPCVGCFWWGTDISEGERE